MLTKMEKLFPFVGRDIRRLIIKKYLSDLDQFLLFSALGLKKKLCDGFTAEAALHGHLEVLRWLRENGCPELNNFILV